MNNIAQASANRADALGKESVGRLLYRFSVPSIVGMLVNATYNVVNRIFIGQGVGSLAIAGLTVAFPLMIIALALNLLVAQGSAAVISIRLGQKRQADAEKVLGSALALVTVIFALLTVAGLVFMKPLLIVFGASEATLPIAEDYLRIIALGFVINGLSFVLNACVRGEGQPRIAMLTMLIGGVTNMLLDPLFIFVFHWGVKGAALGTVLASVVSLTWLLIYYLGGHSLLKIRLSNLKLDKAIILSIISIGFAPFGMQIAASLVNIILNNQMKVYGGDIAVSVIGVLFSLNMMIMMPVIGIAQGNQPIIGYNTGARRFDRVMRSLRLAIGSAVAISTFGFAILMFFASSLVKLFDADDREFVKLGTHAIHIASLMLPAVGFQIVSSNYFQAIGKAWKASLLSLSRQALLLIPALLILPGFFGLEGVLWALPLADGVSSLVTGGFITFEMARLRGLIKAGSESNA